MLKLQYIGDTESYNVQFSIASGSSVQIMGELPFKDTGFILFRPGMKDRWDYTEYTTLYRQIDGGYIFSSDGSMFMPMIRFYASEGGRIASKDLQIADDYSKIVIPEIECDKYYLFTGFEPAIPTSGRIEDNVSFTAQFEERKRTVDFYVNDETRGELKGNLSQEVFDYSELEIPTVLSNNGYYFDGWDENPDSGLIEIPNNGKVEEDIAYTARFEPIREDYTLDNDELTEIVADLMVEVDLLQMGI